MPKIPGQYGCQLLCRDIYPGEYELKQSVGGFNYGNLTEEDKQPIDGFKYDSWKQPEFDSTGLNKLPKNFMESVLTIRM